MFGSNILEVGIGVVLLFLFMSLICTAAREAWETVLKTRGKELDRGIRELLNENSNAGITEKFYSNGNIYSLFSGKYDPNSKDLPSYIPGTNFASALMDMVMQGKLAGTPPTDATTKLDALNLRKAAEKISDEKIRSVMLGAIDLAGDDLDKVRANLIQWFDGSMDRVSGWYKRQTQRFLFVLGLGLAALLNVDAIFIAQQLQQNDTLRKAILVQAERVVEAAPSAAQGSQRQTPPYENLSYDELKGRLKDAGFPVGWPARQFDDDKREWHTPLSMPLGWLITALATMLGAPFWFDVLNKFMVIRSTVKPREKSREEASEDRQNRAAGRLDLVVRQQPASGT